MNQTRNLFLLVIAFLLTVNAYGQGIHDTIWVSNGTTTVVAPGKIRIHTIGTPGHFLDQVQGKYQFIRCKSKNKKQINTLFLTYMDEVSGQEKEIFFYLKYTPEKCREYYPINELFLNKNKGCSIPTTNVEVEVEKEKAKQESERIRLKNKTLSLMDIEDEISDLGISENYLKCFVKLMRVDDRFLYIKNFVINESALDYDLDLISFQYVREYKRGFLKAKAEKPRDVFPAYKSEIKKIKGFTSETLCYAIPIYALQNDENLRIILREKNGRRKININIPAKTIAKSKRL